MSKPDLISSFEFRGHVDVEWFDVPDKFSIPDPPWQQVYALGNLDGKVPVVYYDENPEDYNLPGGNVEEGESIEETMRREVQEEANLVVTSWEPLGYQKCTRPDTGQITYQFRAYAEMKKEAEFISDPGGGVLGYIEVDLTKLNDHIHYGAVGERLAQLAGKYFDV